MCFSKSLVHVGAKEGPLAVLMKTETERWMAEIFISSNQQRRADC